MQAKVPVTERRSLRERQFSLSSPPMPWFGIDIGGSLVKLVYFEPQDVNALMNGASVSDTSNVEAQTAFMIHRYLVGNKAYGSTGLRDTHLQLDNVLINGRQGSLHFIRFPSHKMRNFIQMAKEKGFATLASTVCATGGGAYMYEKIVAEELNLSLFKFDELLSLIRGLEFICKIYPDECYYWENPLNAELCKEVSIGELGIQYPYLIVNVGSGVSILSVRSANDYRRISGSSLGGGMFFGLSCLLTGCGSFEEALALAEKGDHTKADKLVRDIYGGDLELEIFSLPGNTVAASFGHMMDEERRKSVSREDLANTALITITNNIGSIARLCAANEGIQRVLFAGNFLRVNKIAMKSIASAMDYWSQGAMKALFLRHEGYFGAVGCLLQLMHSSELRRIERAHAAANAAIASIHSDSISASVNGINLNSPQDGGSK